MNHFDSEIKIVILIHMCSILMHITDDYMLFKQLKSYMHLDLKNYFNGDSHLIKSYGSIGANIRLLSYAKHNFSSILKQNMKSLVILCEF